jgi:nanoRNase/pAp phosphatase (c-di-AMP/oligoRNAs hydrolase)
VQKRWQTLQACLEGCTEIVILLHDDPDPDAVASGEALRYLLAEQLGIQGRLAYRGVIGRAENRALVDFLQPDCYKLPDENPPQRKPGLALALVDTQPGSGNSPVPAGYDVAIVIDHHSDRDDDTGCLRDVRPWIGASSTMVTQYLQAAGLKPSMRVATALFYGIKTDTKALSRDTSAADVAAYFYLLEFVDVDGLVEIENAQVPAGYFKSLNKAMQSARVYDGLVISYLGQSDYPDLSAEVADLLLRLENVRWVVCMGAYEDQLYVSVRARSDEADAEALAQYIIGKGGTAGGRNTLAGGQLPLKGGDAAQLADDVRGRALDFLKLPQDMEPKPLVT